jgi:hypothetical protein
MSFCNPSPDNVPRRGIQKSFYRATVKMKTASILAHPRSFTLATPACALIQPNTSSIREGGGYACVQIHLVNPNNGKVLGEGDE